MRLSAAQSAFLEHADVGYARGAAQSLMTFRNHKALGYRTAGSAAEHAAGDWIAKEMRKIGLSGVVKHEFPVDAWTFRKADLSFTDAYGSAHTALLGAYQTHFVTDGPKEFSIVYAGRGTLEDLERADVRGKLVLIDINQRDDWWISFPVYEAHLLGAAAVLAAQNGGYAEINDRALNAQDICGPACAAAFSIARADADALKEALRAAPDGSIKVGFDAFSEVVPDGRSHNIVGTIPGRHPNRQLLVTAHYDAYFDGYQDNTIAVAMMLGIAKAVLDSGYRPDKSLVFCALAAEEWGVSDSRFDWSTGAYHQVFHVRPDWPGRTMANINFELPGYSLGNPTAQVRCSYELETFLESFFPCVPAADGAFPDGPETVVPTQTWSDDFSFSIAGIPATVNALRVDYARLRYHTQLDDASTFHEATYRYHHDLYGLLLLAYDALALPPLNFSTRFAALEASVDAAAMRSFGADADALLAAAQKARAWAQSAYARMAGASGAGTTGQGDAGAFADILSIFRRAEDALVRMTWDYVAGFPHEATMNNLVMLTRATTYLEENDAAAALRECLWAVDNNWYAYHWSRETYDHLTNLVMNSRAEKLLWGEGRVAGHVDLYDVVRSLLEKQKQKKTDCSAEHIAVLAALEKQKSLLVALVRDEIDALTELGARLERLASRLESSQGKQIRFP